MAKAFAIPFYNSKQWKQCRKAYITSVFGLCERCRKIGYILHHIKPLTEDNINNPNISLSWDNLMYVCKPCHEAMHSMNNPIRNDVMFDDKGQLVSRTKINRERE